MLPLEYYYGLMFAFGEKFYTMKDQPTHAYVGIDVITESDAFSAFEALDAIGRCYAVRGDIDLLLMIDSSEDFQAKIESVKGIRINFVYQVETNLISKQAEANPTGFVFVEFESTVLGQVSSVIQLDSVISCDVINGNTRIICMVNDNGAVGKTSPVVEKVSLIEGVLRVRSLKIIDMAD